MHPLLEELYRGLVEKAGGLWVGVQYGSKAGPIIMFQRAAGHSTIALYAFALHNEDDVRLALKARLEEDQKVRC